MDFNHVALFVRVVRVGSFTGAAAQVGLPKSSVSRSVQRLEDDLGVRLLQRTTRKLTLTDVGHAFYDSVAGAFTAMDEAEGSAREHDTAPSGLVRIAGPPDSIFARALAEFTRRYPGIRVEASLASRQVDLVAEGFDLAVRAGPSLTDSSLVARRIGTTKLILVASPEYLKRRGRPETMADLAQHDFVLYRATCGKATIKLTGPSGDEEVQVRGALVADDLSFCRYAVEAGAGIGLQPIPVLVEAIVSGKLQQVLPEWSLAGASAFVLLPTTKYVPRRVSLLRDFLIQEWSLELAAIEEKCKSTEGAAKTRRRTR